MSANNNRRLLKICTALLVLLSVTSCQKDEALDVQPRDLFSDANVWTDPGASDLFLNDIYRALPDGNNWYDPLENWSDNSICGFAWPSSRTVIQQGLQAPAVSPLGDIGTFDWSTNYALIRKCNIFISKVAASDLPDTYKKPRVAEARFLRAYYYHLIWMYYGGVPLITEPLDRQTQGEDIFKPRNSSEETLKFISDECAAIYADLLQTPSSGRIGKGAAMALKGWCELFGGKYADAAASNKKIIDELGSVYDLHPSYAGFFLAKGNSSKESILYVEYAPPGYGKGSALDGTVGPTFTKNGAETSWGGVNPTQELVDDYAMDNGKPITDPTSGYDPQQPYKNREQRFYESIVYDASWFYNDTMYMRTGSPNYIDLTDKDDATQTGYYMRKRLDDKSLVLGAANWDGYTSYQNYSLFRFAEVLLNYAEAQNEAAGPDASVYQAINRIRKRGNIDDLPAGLSKDQMRTAIRRERRVELALEDKRYWDLIRWKTAEVNLNQPLHGMKITKKNDGSLVYEVVAATGGNRKFDKSKHYLFAIPQGVIDQNKQLKGKQNPGY
ncbi:RagB/SusD family nutrient uptake outer membrane protein [Paraflavitalea pollutisoli]|uniref:RagB/SusD family nutrient uptake outer membrane protein n=1 Tax=Paraflavitalea pollutisoli TaxID=3034143 RepID=UPI0023EB7EB3|nr:RagB/SusD family nutrient uptake outer membrane protein [Paraflavitalea sp. H1-2-19X]